MSLAPHHPSKKLGQHFLKDLEIAHAIVSAANLDGIDSVLEPGAGHGVITRLLEAKASHVIAVEKDRRLVAELRKEFSKSPSVEIIEGDVLKTRLPAFNKVVGTPPYNISSKLVLLLQGSHFTKAHLVFQKEFAERLKPKIDSVLVSFEPKPYSTDADAMILTDMVRGIFTQRRRLVRGALLHFLKLKLGREHARNIVASLNLPASRVYELSIRELEEIAIQLKPLLPPEPN